MFKRSLFFLFVLVSILSFASTPSIVGKFEITGTDNEKVSIAHRIDNFSIYENLQNCPKEGENWPPDVMAYFITLGDKQAEVELIAQVEFKEDKSYVIDNAKITLGKSYFLALGKEPFQCKYKDLDKGTYEFDGQTLSTIAGDGNKDMSKVTWNEDGSVATLEEISK